jgi:hypothetical protein
MSVTQIAGPCGIPGRLGRHEFIPDSRDFRAINFVAGGALPIAPTRCSWDGPTQDTDPLGNRDYGCCTCAAMGHIIRQGTDITLGQPSSVTTEHVLKAYQEACGWVPGDPSTDQGGYMRDVLKYAQKVGIGGYKIDGYGLIDRTDPLVFAALLKGFHFAFGSLYLGADLPRAAQWQTIWDIPDGQRPVGDYAPRSWGGHAINSVEYDEELLTIHTWGHKQQLTYRWAWTYIVEPWVVWSSRSWAPAGKAPSLFLPAELKQAIEKLA